MGQYKARLGNIEMLYHLGQLLWPTIQKNELYLVHIKVIHKEVRRLGGRKRPVSA
jgi:hypothetical protein